MSRINPNKSLLEQVSKRGGTTASRFAATNPPAAQAGPRAEPETFIVRNVTPGPHSISDINMHFGPWEVIDLTWEDPYFVRSSVDLRNSLRKGYLQRINQEQWDEILERELQREIAERRKEDRQRELEAVEAGDRTFNAESTDLYSGKNNQQEVSTAGYVNDPLTFALAFAEAQADAAARGEVLDAETWGANQIKLAEKRGNKMDVQGSGRRGRTISGAQSGNSAGKAYVAVPNHDGLEAANVGFVNSLAGDRDAYYFPETSVNESIDLGAELAVEETGPPASGGGRNRPARRK